MFRKHPLRKKSGTFSALQFLRQRHDVSEEIAKMKNEEMLVKQDETTEKFTFFWLIKNKEYHLPLFLAFVLSVSMTGTGMSGVGMITLYLMHLLFALKLDFRKHS